MPYSTFLVAVCGIEDFLWSVSQGVVPPWLALDAFTGELSGTPPAEEVLTFTVRVDKNPV